MNGTPTKSGPVKIKDSPIVVLVDSALEGQRSRLYAPILKRLGTVKHATSFPKKYEPMDPWGRCFDNAMRTACRYGLRYMEGLLLYEIEGGGSGSMAHGWCEDSTGQIVDPTLSRWQDHPSISFHGVCIQIEYSLSWLERVGYFGCLDGDVNDRAIGPNFEPESEWFGGAINCTRVSA